MASETILQPNPKAVRQHVPQVSIEYYPPRGDQKEG